MAQRTTKDLKPNPKNPRTISASKKKMLAKALKQFGDLSGIVFNRRSQMLVGGHQRVDVLGEGEVHLTKSLEAPDKQGTVGEGFVETKTGRHAYREVDWDEDTEKAANLAANKGAGEFDLGMVGEWLKDLELDDFNLDLTMFSEDERQDILATDAISDDENGEAAEDEIPESAESRVTSGDIWQLGEHRLACGSSGDFLVIAKLCPDERCQLLVTSPPYDQQRDYHAKISDWETLMQNVFCSAPLAETAQLLVNLGLYYRDFEWVPYWDPWLAFMSSEGWRKFAWYVWDQGAMVPRLAHGRLGSSFEFIFHLNKKQRDPNKITATKEGSRGEVQFNIGRTASGDKKMSGMMSLGTHRTPDNVIRIERRQGASALKETGDHPAVFPVKLPDFLIRAFSEPGELVFEPFCGSGSTLIACEQNGRKCRAVEMSPTYCDVILARWEKATGQVATRISQVCSGTAEGAVADA